MGDVRPPGSEDALGERDDRSGRRGVAPDADSDRNLTHLRASLPPGGEADVRAMPVVAHELEAAAADYARSLPESFDLIHLGLGPDGHTASLVPGDAVLNVLDRDVALTDVYQGRRRMTLTYPTLNKARLVLWLVTGEDKIDALQRLRAGDRSIPQGGSRQRAPSSSPTQRPREIDRLVHFADARPAHPARRPPWRPSKRGTTACSTTPTVAESRAASTPGSSNSPVKSAMTPPSGPGRDVTKPHSAEPAKRRTEPVLEQLERDGRRQPLDVLVGGEDRDEGVRRRSHRLLTRVSRSATLDEPPVRRDLVGPIDRDVQHGESLGPAERLDAHAELSRGVRGRRRRGDAPQVEVARREGRKEERDSRAGSESDEHPVLDQLRRRLGGELLLPVDAHETTTYLTAFRDARNHPRSIGTIRRPLTRCTGKSETLSIRAQSIVIGPVFDLR